jgi:hypothetical protein
LHGRAGSSQQIDQKRLALGLEITAQAQAEHREHP